MDEITAICRAKVNLTLDVFDRRADGYHNLESVVQSVDLSDVVRVSRSSGTRIEVTSNSHGVPSGEENTVYTACMLFKQAAGIEAGIEVSIEKQIPLQAGLGGGSSDAAGTLMALNQLFDCPFSRSELVDLAVQIGSDVPFFLVGGTAVIKGRGDVVEKLPDAPELHFVIVKPAAGVSTPSAYGLLDEIPNRHSAAATADMVSAIRRGDRNVIINHLSNDFEDVVTSEVPDIAEIKEQIKKLGGDNSLLCGSGSAVFGVFSNQQKAMHAADELNSKYPFVTTASSSSTAITLSEVSHGN